jgi:adenylosuccinate synthase
MLAEPHNTDSGHQGRFRVGVFDAVAAKYAAEVAGADELALTHLDRIPILPDHICTEYRSDSNAALRLYALPNTDLHTRELLTLAVHRCTPVFEPVSTRTAGAFVAAVQGNLALPVRLLSFGPRPTDKHSCLS